MSQAQTLKSTFPSHFIWRRLHSLSGLVPVGVFLLEHIYTNAYSLVSPEKYNDKIAGLQGIPFVVLIEIFGIFLPLMFHALYGLVIVYKGKSNVHQYGYESNWRYTAQRITGVIGLIFICYHVSATRLTSYFNQEPMSYQWMQDLLQSPWKMWFYLVGSIGIIFHFCNGLWTFCIVWGITVTKVAQKLSLQVFMGLFALLASVNTLIVLNFAYPVGQRPAILEAIFHFIQTWLFGTH